jgi:hypothetical protein
MAISNNRRQQLQELKQVVKSDAFIVENNNGQAEELKKSKRHKEIEQSRERAEEAINSEQVSKEKE